MSVIDDLSSGILTSPSSSHPGQAGLVLPGTGTLTARTLPEPDYPGELPTAKSLHQYSGMPAPVP